jgi:hypothetical protein
MLTKSTSDQQDHQRTELVADTCARECSCDKSSKPSNVEHADCRLNQVLAVVVVGILLFRVSRVKSRTADQELLQLAQLRRRAKPQERSGSFPLGLAYVPFLEV